MKRAIVFLLALSLVVVLPLAVAAGQTDAGESEEGVQTEVPVGNAAVKVESTTPNDVPADDVSGDTSNIISPPPDVAPATVGPNEVE